MVIASGSRPERLGAPAAWPTSPRTSPLTVMPNQLVEIVDGKSPRPLDGLGVISKELGQVHDGFGARPEQAPHVAGAATGPAQMEDRVRGRLSLITGALAEAVEGDPGHGDAVRGEHPRAQRF